MCMLTADGYTNCRVRWDLAGNTVSTEESARLRMQVSIVEIKCTFLLKHTSQARIGGIIAS